MPPKTHRDRQIAKIHLAAKQLALTDDTYRAILRQYAGVESCRDADALGLGKVLARLYHLGWRPRIGKKRPRASEDRAPRLRKIFALLGDRPVEYAEGILKRMYGERAPAKLEWADGDQLHKLIAVLTYDAKRKAAQEDLS